MRKTISWMLTGALLAGFVLPAHAQGLLGGLIGEEGLVSISAGEASNSGLVNVGLGGGDGNLVDLNVGGDRAPLANANIGTGNGSTLGIDANVGGNLANAAVNVGEVWSMPTCDCSTTMWASTQPLAGPA